MLTDALAPFGVHHRAGDPARAPLRPEYEKVIHDRKLAEQRAEQLKSETEAAQQEALRNLETARGKVASDIAAADGKLKQAKLSRRRRATSPSSRTPTPSWPSAPPTPRPSPSATRRCAASAAAPWSSCKIAEALRGQVDRPRSPAARRGVGVQQARHQQAHRHIQGRRQERQHGALRPLSGWKRERGWGGFLSARPQVQGGWSMLLTLGIIALRRLDRLPGPLRAGRHGGPPADRPVGGRADSSHGLGRGLRPS